MASLTKQLLGPKLKRPGTPAWQEMPRGAVIISRLRLPPLRPTFRVAAAPCGVYAQPASIYAGLVKTHAIPGREHVACRSFVVTGGSAVDCLPW